MTTTNKFIGKMIFLFVGVLALTACSPEDGKDGNANVIASEWITADFDVNTAGTSFSVEDPDITQEVKDSGVILAYGKDSLGTIASIPLVNGKMSYYFYVDSPGIIHFYGHSTDGSNQDFSLIREVRYVIIPSSTVGATNKVRSFQDMSYYEVMDYLGLEY